MKINTPNADIIFADVRDVTKINEEYWEIKLGPNPDGNTYISASTEELVELIKLVFRLDPEIFWACGSF